MSITSQLAASELLIRLFSRHFDDPVSAVLHFEERVKDLGLKFDILSRIREIPFPSQPSVPNGLPSFIYYYVPDSGRGTNIGVTSDPLAREFTNTGDGIGLNMGCPVRLARALDALSWLPEKEQKETLGDLRSATKHLATIEELLWIRGWKNAQHLQRGGSVCGSKKQVDWYFKASDCPMYLEAKFRPSDWAYFSEQGTYEPTQGSLLGRAGKQFPVERCDDALRVVCVTTPATLREKQVHDYGRELEGLPQIDAVVFRSMTQMTHVMSLHLQIRDKVLGLLVTPSIREFPVNYFVIWNTKERDERVSKRLKQQAVSNECVKSRVYCWGLEPVIDASIPIAPEGAYRAVIESRAEDGEPTIEQIPRELGE